MELRINFHVSNANRKSIRNLKTQWKIGEGKRKQKSFHECLDKV